MIRTFRLTRLTLALGLAFGLTAQATAATWNLQDSSARKTTIENQLIQFNQSLDSTNRENKYSQMETSAFVFYRGTAHIYYYDLDQQNTIAGSPYQNGDAVTWIQGDMHTNNFGAFDNDEEKVVYDLNDFDEAWVTSYLYDVWRAGASLVLVARENGGFGNSNINSILNTFGETYLDTLEDYRGNSDEKGAEVKESNAYGLLDEFLHDAESDNSRKDMLAKWTNKGSSSRYFDLSMNNLGSISASEYATIESAINSYKDNLTSSLAGDSSYFEVHDIAERLNAGVGSLGTQRYYVLIEGETSGMDDDRILDVKLQGTPAVYPYLSASQQQNVTAEIADMGCRVAIAQKAMLTNVDDHLGCASIYGDSYSVRERSPFKETFDTTDLTSMTRFTKMAEQWGKILATAHARADKDFDSALVPTQFESVMHDLTDGEHSEFRSELRDIAKGYADQVEADYNFFVQLRNSGAL